MKACFVHGFNVKDGGRRTIDQVIPGFRAAGIEVDADEADYGYFNLFMIRLIRSRHRDRMLGRLAKAFESADVIVTHSNGAHFATRAMDMLGPEHNNTKTVIHISPALNRRTEPPAAVKRQLVMHTPYDIWVRLASYLPFMPWGRMGAFGYSGDSPKVTNLKRSEVHRHSDWFIHKHLKQTRIDCLEFALERKL
jgi:hypothetical protein